MLSGIHAVVREYYDPDATIVYVVMAVLWPITAVGLVVVAVWGILFSIGYLIGKLYRLLKPSKEKPIA